MEVADLVMHLGADLIGVAAAMKGDVKEEVAKPADHLVRAIGIRVYQGRD